MSKKSQTKRFAVGLVVDGSIAAVPFRHLTIEKAEVFQRVHNRLCPREPVVILSHPLSPAVMKLARRRRAAVCPA